MPNNIINQYVVPFVQRTLKNAEGGHDWFHIERVWNMSKYIANLEYPNNLLTIELGALLHDIADSKFHDGDETIGPKLAEEFMYSINIDSNTIDHVLAIINNISFKGGNFDQKYKSKELYIVQDADRLDALGAIGIARTFNYGGFKNRKLYDPTILPQMHMDKESYKKSTAPTINHFYEKLFLLKDRMNTKTGIKLAEERHQFMEKFMDQFMNEVNFNKVSL